MGTIANAKFTHFYNCYNGYFIGCLREFPKGKREVWYHRAQTIKTEIKQADGWESDIKSDETTDRTFWGYIVTLTDVTISPLEK